MKNLGTLTLVTERLILRRIKIEDAEKSYLNYTSDPKTAYYVMWNKHESIDDTRKLFDRWIEEYKLPNNYRWIVELKETHEIIGTIDLVGMSLRHKRCEIGYCYGSKYWGNGYASEALKRVISFLIDEVGFETVIAEHVSSNPNSGKVMLKAGMTYEATLRSRYINKNTNQREDLLVYSVIK